jgi:hypothetical protein
MGLGLCFAVLPSIVATTRVYILPFIIIDSEAVNIAIEEGTICLDLLVNDSVQFGTATFGQVCPTKLLLNFVF